MFYKCLFTVPLQVQTSTNYFKQFETGSVLINMLCWGAHLFHLKADQNGGFSNGWAIAIAIFKFKMTTICSVFNWLGCLVYKWH